MHHISQKKFGKVGEMALKLDMSKAYDRVEWACMENIMRKMGVRQRMIEVIMRCIMTITFSIKESCPLRASAKGTHYHLIYFSFVQRVFQLFFVMQQKGKLSMELLCIGKLQEFSIYSLLTIA